MNDLLLVIDMQNFTIKISMGKVNPVFLFSNLLQNIPLLYIYN